MAAVAAMKTGRIGAAGYVLTPFAAVLLSPALAALPWFDAGARSGTPQHVRTHATQAALNMRSPMRRAV